MRDMFAKLYEENIRKIYEIKISTEIISIKFLS